MMDKPFFVIDTNILVDYPDIIPSEGETVVLEEPTVDLSNGHIVIPTAVIRELSKFKKETSERGKMARKILKRLRELFEGQRLGMNDSYNLKSGVAVGDKIFSILPIHKRFKDSLPFSPSVEDMDGQIILAALAVEFICHSIPVDGTADQCCFEKYALDKSVTLLTNDNGLAIRATRRGVATSRYGYKLPPPYTGRREVIVPKDILDYFFSTHYIEMDVWNTMVPSEANREMVANEFIVMHLEDPTEDCRYKHNSYFQHVGRYDKARNVILPLQYATEFPEHIMNEGQAIYAEALMNPDFPAVICTGPAGSGKTYMATVYGYHACKTGNYIGVTVVPCASQSRIGALPGNLNEKMDPDVQPLKNALRNYLLKTDRALKMELKEIQEHGATLPEPKSASADDATSGDNRSISQKLTDKINAIWDAWFNNLPIENARGRDFSYELALYDEFQDQNATQADTLIKRLGMNGKIIITGDTEQVHAPYLDADNNGLVYASQLLYDNPMVAQVHFTEEEVIRHPLVKMVTERQKAEKNTPQL